MIIERHLSPYLVFTEDPILVALRKMTENTERIVFCVDSHGYVHGSISDGDFRRWIIANPQADLDVSAAVVANRDVVTLGLGPAPRPWPRCCHPVPPICRCWMTAVVWRRWRSTGRPNYGSADVRWAPGTRRS